MLNRVLLYKKKFNTLVDELIDKYLVDCLYRLKNHYEKNVNCIIKYTKWYSYYSSENCCKCYVTLFLYQIRSFVFDMLRIKELINDYTYQIKSKLLVETLTLDMYR